MLTAPGAGTLPLYRLYFPGGDHFYTTSQAEHDYVVAHGFRDEGTAGFLYASP